MVGWIAMLSLAWGSPVESSPAWGLEIAVASQARAPLAGDVHAMTRSLLLATWARTPQGYEVEHTVCAIRVHDDVRMSRTTIPQAYVAALTPQRYRMTLVEERSEMGGVRWRLRADFGVRRIGYQPAEHGVDVVPESADDPRVVDQDGDGHPGATVELKLPLVGQVQVYTAQRSQTIIDGLWLGDHFSGAVRIPAHEQRTLGASNRMFDRNAPSSVVDAESRFAMWPVSQGTTCDALAAAWDPQPTAWTDRKLRRKEEREATP